MSLATIALNPLTAMLYFSLVMLYISLLSPNFRYTENVGDSFTKNVSLTFIYGV